MEMHENTSAIWGILAEFKDAEAMMHAAEKVRDAGYTAVDGYTPFPVHGMEKALGIKKTRLAAAVLCGGLTGGTLAFSTMTIATVFHYPFNTGGKPYFSWPAYIPITFELTILFSALTAALTMILRNGLPQPYHPLFNVKAFEKASRDGFFISIETRDPKFSLDSTKAFLQGIGAVGVYEVNP